MSWDALTAEECGHAALALKLYFDRARRSGIAVPPRLFRDHEDLSRRAIRRQTATPLEDLWAVIKTEAVQPKLLTITQAGDVLGMSPRTVQRRIADGSLPSTRIGGTTRIRVSDLDAFIERG